MKERSLKKRIKEGKISREDVVRRLAELAFGQANDCVELVLGQEPDIGKLDLGLLCEVKRSEKGAGEVKLMDRLRALEQLSALTGEDGGQLEEFLRALQGSGDAD